MAKTLKRIVVVLKCSKYSVQNVCPLQTSATEAPLSGEKGNDSDRKEANQVGATNGKKKKHRRGKCKRKPNKPYNKTAWTQRKNVQKEMMRVRSARAKILAMGHTLVPCNTNQFLMEDHDLSVDSEDNYFMSLPEDEEDFLIKEFSSVYEDAQCERLNAMTKNELIQECILMESRLDHLTKTIRNAKSERMHKQSGNECDAATSEKLQEQAARIQELLAENLELRRERDYFASVQRTISSTSTDSESDSSMHSSSMSSPSSSLEESTTEASPVIRNGLVQSSPDSQTRRRSSSLKMCIIMHLLFCICDTLSLFKLLLRIM
ncbi:protein HEXIM1 [Ctenocephalides felis]|uniref:protein HEXIM1 n=1 Tax=Ctenocephalides felis TaxID=7515 RepID=UPI000E6E464D|nr:protein HEXIM1 [Ctenocephalides felis]